jgi:hypothetical protein
LYVCIYKDRLSLIDFIYIEITRWKKDGDR